MLQLRPGKAQTGHTERQVPGSFWLAAAILLAASMLLRAVNHDESQYVAAIAMMRGALPYRDFAYLQTPLQPLLLSPLAYLPAGWTFVAARIANAAFGFGTLLLLWAALRRRASGQAIFVALAAMLCTDAFLLASSLARNDALAMVLLAAALPPLLSGTETKAPWKLALGGLCVGFATSAKISAALPGLGAGVFLLIRARRLGAGAPAAFAAGFVVGLLPILVLGAIAPAEFRFDVFGYNLAAPAQWWTSIGEQNELRPFQRLLKLLGQASLGSVLVAVAAAALDREDTDGRRLLDFMIVGGLVAAYLPAPALTQYLVPLLPPLFARFALALDDSPPKRRAAFHVLVVVGSIAGLASDFVVRPSRFEALQSVPLGHEVTALARGGRVVTLSPEYIAGDGVELDPRFAAGPFLFRTRGRLARLAEVDGKAVSAKSAAAALSSSEPAVILVGRETEPFPPYFPRGLDQPLADWARAHGYRPESLREGFVAFVQPRS